MVVEVAHCTTLGSTLCIDGNVNDSTLPELYIAQPAQQLTQPFDPSILPTNSFSVLLKLARVFLLLLLYPRVKQSCFLILSVTPHHCSP